MSPGTMRDCQLSSTLISFDLGLRLTTDAHTKFQQHAAHDILTVFSNVFQNSSENVLTKTARKKAWNEVMKLS
jgi:hypothetical protein